MNIKKIIIVLISITIIMFAILGYLTYRQKNNQIQSNNNTVTNQENYIKPSPTLQKPEGVKITLQTVSGAVSVNNFMEKASKIVETQAYLTENSRFTIIFNGESSDFLINLWAYDSSQGRKYRAEAEDYLLNALGINKTLACNLTVHEIIPYSYSQQLSNVDYGLSFCSAGKQIN